MSERIQVEFDDRYGGYRPPWNYCRGQCEAMGVVAVQLRFAADGMAMAIGEDPRLLARAVGQHLRGEGHEDGHCDGWHFVECPDCDGTGEISKLRALRYQPRKVRGALRFVWDHGVLGYSRPPWMSRREQLVMTLRITAGRSPR